MGDVYILQAVCLLSLRILPPGLASVTDVCFVITSAGCSLLSSPLPQMCLNFPLFHSVALPELPLSQDFTEDLGIVERSEDR